MGFQSKNLKRGKIEFNVKNQGKLFLVSIAIILGYFGLLSRIAMNYGQPIQISYLNWDGRYILWSFLLYPKAYFLPPILLFVCFFIYTYFEDIPQYGIKLALWFAPLIQLQGLVWYWVMYGFSAQPLQYLFLSYQGYLSFLIILLLNVLGAICGMQYKKYTVMKKLQMENEGR